MRLLVHTFVLKINVTCTYNLICQLLCTSIIIFITNNDTLFRFDLLYTPKNPTFLLFTFFKRIPFGLIFFLVQKQFGLKKHLNIISYKNIFLFFPGLEGVNIQMTSEVLSPQAHQVTKRTPATAGYPSRLKWGARTRV